MEREGEWVQGEERDRYQDLGLIKHSAKLETFYNLHCLIDTNHTLKHD